MAILANQKILTLDYWKIANDLKPGDIIFDLHGKPRKITLVQQYRSDTCYELVTKDNLAVCGDNHLKLWCEDMPYRQYTSYGQGTTKPGWATKYKIKPMDVETLLEDYEPFSITTTTGLELPHQDLPVPPFIFGFWFFNRRYNKTMAAPPEYDDAVKQMFKDYGYKIRERELLPKGTRTFTVTPTIESQLVGIPTHKMPNNYLLASKEQRLELLRGIIHAKTKRYSEKKNQFKFASKKPHLVLQMQMLLESLGMRIHVRDHPRNYTAIYFRTRLRLVEQQREERGKVHNGRRFIKFIRTLPPQLCVHIETDGPDNSYLVGEGFIPCQ